MNVSDKRERKTSLEVSSDQLQDELIAIKDRLSAIETIESISNAPVVIKYVQEHVSTPRRKQIMEACREPKTRAQLVNLFGLNSKQALDHDLRPLREADLLRRMVQEDGEITFAWSNLFRALPKARIRELLASDSERSSKRAVT